MRFVRCISCGDPFPVFAGNPKRCVPCRKEANGERLTKSDLAFRHIHEHYASKVIVLKEKVEYLDEMNREMAKRLTKIGISGISEDEVIRLRQHNRSLRTRLEEERRQVSGLRRQLDQAERRIRELATGAVRGVTSAANLLPDVSVRDLLRLCHPDRWSGTANEDLANEVTKKLLEAR